ncbi:Kynurenine/alpha-aminoadipate aminotransferase mitochondrial [Wickerhamomyces ciferrii]|uniref:Kynurenine/alpha-aminoadipate aminotransferase mitochondrial n=1 Tax=Wickerhamomyces ciferrii (strain ATCC 14091 / BCRC 22168 / CBS 111 / JCM 3599 / NBRC 0793 / NRRL Y-1031 F-60-10) TaxID=1206466 RepID=K0KIW4_WICCF|nr:Kynurenine/alpha-aminoadipate aminotransferase mitochondrial [Wickerhamomyces ciferrii]CCH42921.1 Kynurenine/alpha-aminoadipate aminotransferase mitochondrial [Wickerhamomyces ciferrii]
MSFEPEKYFNKEEIESSDFYLPLPPKPYPIHSDLINLSGGRPNSGFYPVESISLNLKKSPFDKNPTTESLEIPFDNEGSTSELDITQGLQYAPGQGFPQLLSQISKFTQFHGANIDEFQSLITSGSGDSLNKILQGFIDPDDTILVENYTYTPIFATFKFNKGIMIPLPIEFDPSGTNPHLNPETLEDILKNWHKGPYKDLKFPKFLFTVPTQNPSGLLTSFEIIQKVLKIVETFDLLIIEDDPDGFIRHLPEIPKNEEIITNVKFQEYKKSLHNSSYLSTNSPRVLHLVSKTTTKAPSGLSQLVLTNLIKHWNESISSIIEDGDEREEIDGYLSWTYKVSLEYTKRSEGLFNHFQTLKSVTRKLISPIKPQGGMFFIIKFNFKLDRGQFEALRFKFIKYGVLVILGNLMSFDNEYSANSDFIRLTLSNVDKVDELIEGVDRLDKAVLEYYDLDYGTDTC